MASATNAGHFASSSTLGCHAAANFHIPIHRMCASVALLCVKLAAAEHGTATPGRALVASHCNIPTSMCALRRLSRVTLVVLICWNQLLCVGCGSVAAPRPVSYSALPTWCWCTEIELPGNQSLSSIVIPRNVTLPTIRCTYLP